MSFNSGNAASHSLQTANGTARRMTLDFTYIAGEMQDGVTEHLRLVLDILSTVTSAFQLSVLRVSDIRGTHSFLLLVHSAIANLVLTGFSLVIYALLESALLDEWILALVSKLQTIFVVLSLNFDLLLVVNIYLAVTMGVSYKDSMKRIHIIIGIVLSWAWSVTAGSSLFILTCISYHIPISAGKLMLSVAFFGVPVIIGSNVANVVMFFRISTFVRNTYSAESSGIHAVTQARLEFVKVLKILLAFRMLLYLSMMLVNVSLVAFVGKNPFYVTVLVVTVFSIGRDIIFLVLQKPLRNAAKMLIMKLTQCRSSIVTPQLHQDRQHLPQVLVGRSAHSTA